MFNRNKPEYREVRRDTLDEIDAFAKNGTPMSGFVFYVLANDLIRAVQMADQDNIRDIREIVSYVYNEIPSECWGSYGIVDEWMDRKGQTFVKSKAAKRKPVYNVAGNYEMLGEM